MTSEYRPSSMLERRIIALYIVGILIGAAGGFVMASILYGLNNLFC